MAESTPSHLEPSALGTKEYWDSLYEKELSNHAENPQDEGTVWFDDADAEAKMVAYLDELAEEDDGRLDRAAAAVLDLGCGNGSLLFALRDDGWRGRLLGVDYSERSVELARRVGRSRQRRRRRRRRPACGDEDYDDDDGDDDGDNLDTEEKQEEKEKENDNDVDDDGKEKEVEFKVWDVLQGPLADVRAAPTEKTSAQGSERDQGWDLVLDKGTFDAVSLSGERDDKGRRVFEGYGERVLQLLRTGGLFLVTSCNWTEEELRGWFETKTPPTPTGERLRLAGRIQYPSFEFGGVRGQTISTLCFEKSGGLIEEQE